METYYTLIIIIIYHDFLPTPRRGSHVKSDKTHTDIKIQPDNIKRNIRNIETTVKKFANAKIAAIFNNTCLNIYIYI